MAPRSNGVASSPAAADARDARIRLDTMRWSELLQQRTHGHLASTPDTIGYIIPALLTAANSNARDYRVDRFKSSLTSSEHRRLE